MNTQAKFTTGSTMRHVVEMTLTGSLGLTFMFLVDFLALWWISRLDNEMLISAIGFAGTIQFFVISIAIGMMIGAVAMVARTLGEGDVEKARRIATASMIYAGVVQTIIAVLVYVFCRDILIWTGATGETLEVAVSFLSISLPSLPFIAVGMTASAVLRAAGYAWRSMLVTVVGGAVAIVIDPLFIVYFGWGIQGAALAIVISRFAMLVMGLYWAGVARKMLAMPRLGDLRVFLWPFLAIGLPAIATQVSTPFGNWVLIRVMAEHGDSAVAGLGVVGRIQALAFGGIFALSGAIGGIIGQNHGAKLYDRVESSYFDALKFCAYYTLVVWVLLIIASRPMAESFNLGPEGVEVVRTFTHFAALSFVFTGALFVSNAAFNNLGRPLWATAANWFRDGIIMFPIAIVMGMWFGANGVVLAQGVANTIAGTLAAWMGLRFVRHIRAKHGA